MSQNVSTETRRASRPKNSSRPAYAPPFEPFEEGPAFHDLAALLRSKRPPLVLVGAGASMGSGYPSWLDLLERLKGLALEQETAVWRRAIGDLNDAPWTAEVFARRLPPGGLGRLIHDEFKSRGKLDEPHLTLAGMPFPHFLTTNYDPCIEEALDRVGRPYRRVVWSDQSTVSDFLIGLSDREAPCSVVYLHGRYDNDEADIVLTETNYVARYVASDDARRKLMAIFMTHPVVFVGFSMNDPDLANLMREVTARLKTSKPCHFALMSYKGEADREAIRERMEGKFGVRPVFFSRTPSVQGADEYSNQLLLLDALTGRAGRKIEAKTTAMTTIDPEDPHKGQFGGLSVADGRRLTVVRTGGSEEEGRLYFQLVVEALPGGPPLKGGVTFHLHPTFPKEVVSVRAKDGRAVLSRWAWGAFTVGVRADGGDTSLELDLAEQPDLPLWFRRQ